MDDRTNHHDLVVIGAGIAGLVAANTALDAGLRPIVIEAHPPGGRARTVDRDGWSLNLGAHGLYVGGQLRRCLTGWGLTPSGGTPSDIQLFGLRDGTLSPFPVDPASILRTRLLGRRSKIRFAALFARLGRLDVDALTGTALSEWLADEPDDVRATIESIVRTATYCNAPDLLDAGAAIAQLRLAAGGVRYVDGGWGSIVGALVGRLRQRGVVVRQTAARGVHEDRTEVTVVLEESGEELRTETVVIAAGGPEVEARLMNGPSPDAGPAIEACAVDVLVGRPVERRGIFGIDEARYLVPHSSVAALAPGGRGLLSGLHYLRPGSPPAAPDDERDATRRLAELLGVGHDDIVELRLLHRSTVAHGLPTAAGGGLGGRPGITIGDRILRAGDWVGPTGMLADAAAASGVAAATAAARCARITT